jgi:hypothetical protein
MLLFTSIKPPATEDELSYLRDCLNSWRAAGFEPVAVNGPSEIKALRCLDLPVEFGPLPLDGKPRIGAILDAIRNSGAPFAGIINSDCRMIGYPNVATTLLAALDDSLILGWRMDVGSDSPPAPMHGGFDAFFFDTSILPDDDAGFSIGEPWWDLWFPLAARAAGARLETLGVPLLTHHRHPMNWGDRQYQYGGERLLAFLDTRQCRDFVGRPLDVLVQSIPLSLHKQARTISLLGPELADVETMLQLGSHAMIERTYREAGLWSEVVRARAEVEAIKNSTCWRLTAPLRVLIEALRRPWRGMTPVAEA